LEIKGEQITWRSAANRDGFQTALKVNPSKQSKEFDLGPIHISGKRQEYSTGSPGIYELKGDTLRVCYGGDGTQRPKEFKTTPRNPDGSDPGDPYERILVFERVKDKEPGK